MTTLSRLSAVALALAVTLTFVTMTSLSAQSAAPDVAPARWEHLALTQESGQVGGDRDVSRKIVKLGEQGWELVTVSTTVEDGSTTKAVFYFKRPK